MIEFAIKRYTEVPVGKYRNVYEEERRHSGGLGTSNEEILEEGQVRSTRTSRRAYMNRLMTVDEAKEERRDRRSWCSVLSGYTARDTALN